MYRYPVTFYTHRLLKYTSVSLLISFVFLLLSATCDVSNERKCKHEAVLSNVTGLSSSRGFLMGNRDFDKSSAYGRHHGLHTMK